jgi:hypothetical protein
MIQHWHIVQCWGYLISYDHQLYRFTPLRHTFQIVNWFYYNLTLTIIYYAMSHLHSLQSYTPVFHSWRLHIVFITHFKLKLHIFTLPVSVSYRELSSRTDSANSLLKTEISLLTASCCLATGSQKALLRDVSVFTTALPWKRAWCRVTSSRHVV